MMIKLDTKYSQALVDDLIQDLLLHVEKKSTLFNRKYANEYSGHLKLILDKNNLSDLIFCKQDEHAVLIKELFELLPPVEEYYCPELFFSELVVDEAYMDIQCITTSDKDKILKYRNILLSNMLSFLDKKRSYLLPLLFDELYEASTAGAVKRVVSNAIRLRNGSFPRQSERHLSFPCWVIDFKDIFDYGYLSEHYGYRVVDEHGASICPYCNEEDIKIVKGNKKHRPDLDHFFPKSKIPFLSININNLIPSGTRCNKSFKKDDLIFTLKSPINFGIDNTPLFDSSDFSTTNATIQDVTIRVLNNVEFEKNLNLFQIQNVYDSNDHKKTYLSIKKHVGYLVEKGSEKGSISLKEELDDLLGIELNDNPKNTRGKKFYIDTLNKLSKLNFKFT